MASPKAVPSGLPWRNCSASTSRNFPSPTSWPCFSTCSPHPRVCHPPRLEPRGRCPAAAPSRHIELVARKPYALYGAEHIEPGALHQMDTAMKLPVTVAGALMPDAHHGYGLPIGACWLLIMP
ncbi:hypothetical protein [Hymenobacter cellulosilyticus]|uniref:3'-phosphate/5'-hydroxy nucleic acid ligase n=1 Tax=Hymenobacter cellulosilyticus TaxID=2932248 RepID=A0A8T9Q6P3_9BACT|nr:hypothetical protein [Hymenobacter cellulosilyticus]UOQ71440.1 hypothetical protein MUN79_22920 [Hymenobacter cellulosilyticus]